MFLHFRPRRCAHPKPPRTADDSFPDSAIIRLLIPASPDHTKRCPATTLPPPNALALRSALPSLPASLLLKALSASAKPPSPASLPNASMPAASTTARTIPSSPISTKPSPAPLFALRCTSSLSARSASAKPSPLKLPARSSPISSWKRTAFSPTSISTTPSSSSTSAITKPSPRTFPLPTWSSTSRPSPKSFARAYEHFFFRYAASDLLVINTSDIDFVERSDDLQLLLRRLQEPVKGTQYSLPLGASE